MRFIIEIIDVNEFMSGINVYGRQDYATKMMVLEKLPYMKRSEVFENAISLACRLRSAGFDVEIQRIGNTGFGAEVNK